MRALLLTSIGVACAGALLLPLAPTESAESPLTDKHAASADDAVPPSVRAAGAAPAQQGGPVPGHTQSLALGAPGDVTRSGDQLLSAWEDDPSGGRRIVSRKVKPFALVGVVWDDARAVPRDQLQVQTRSSGTGRWSAWQSLNTHGDDRPDRDAVERSDAKAVGSTAPLWVGNSSEVRVRVLPASDADGASPKSSGSGGPRQQPRQPELPTGARLELVDPGSDGPAAGRHGKGGNNRHHKEQHGKPGAERADGHAKRPGGVLPALSRAETKARYGKSAAKAAKAAAAKAAEAGRSDHAGQSGRTGKDRRANTSIGPRPEIVTRKGWGADESLREQAFRYTQSVKAVFVHHTAETNGYSCDQVPSIIRGIYRYHVKSSRWRDIGYNFLVDKCGKVYEGRAGGVARAVMGAHTFGFNVDTTSIAVLGTYSGTAPARPAVEAVGGLAAWKLGVHGVGATSKVTLTSGGGTKYRKGSRVSFHAIAAHRDGYATECPGDTLYNELPAIRTAAGRLQGR